MIHDDDAKTFYIHEPITPLPRTDRISQNKEHKAVRRYLEILKDKRGCKV